MPYIPVGFTPEEEKELIENSRVQRRNAEKDANLRAVSVAVAVGGFFLTLAKLGELIRQRRRERA